MDATWLRLVVDGGALVLLACVLFGVWKLGGRFLDIVNVQSQQAQEGIRVQERLLENIKQLTQAVIDHETRTLGRLDAYQQQSLVWMDEHEEKAVARQRELLRKLNPPPSPGKRGE